MRFSKSIQGYFLVARGFCFWLNTASAYIPPSLFILKTWVGKHARQKKLKITHLVTPGGGSQNSPAHFKEVLMASEGQLLRSWAVNDSNEVLFYQEKVVKEWSLPTQLLMSSDWVTLGRLLKDMGVPMVTQNRPSQSEPVEIEQQSLVRWKDTISWVISEKPIQKQHPQIWFEKDTFLPLRMLYSPNHDSKSYNHDSKSYDVAFDNFRKDFSYPRMVSLSDSSGRVLLTSQVVDLGPASESTKWPRPSSHGWTAAGNSVPSELKDLIELYYKSFR